MDSRALSGGGGVAGEAIEVDDPVAEVGETDARGPARELGEQARAISSASSQVKARIRSWSLERVADGGVHHDLGQVERGLVSFSM